LDSAKPGHIETSDQLPKRFMMSKVLRKLSREYLNSPTFKFHISF